MIYGRHQTACGRYQLTQILLQNFAVIYGSYRLAAKKFYDIRSQDNNDYTWYLQTSSTQKAENRLDLSGL